MMKLKFLALFTIVCSISLSCTMFAGNSSLEIQNKTNGSLVIMEITGRFQVSNKVNLPSNNSKVFEKNFTGAEGCKISLLYNNKNYLINTGYIQDYHKVIVSIEDPGKYTVFNDKTKLFSKEFSK